MENKYKFNITNSKMLKKQNTTVNNDTSNYINQYNILQEQPYRNQIIPNAYARHTSFNILNNIPQEQHNIQNNINQDQTYHNENKPNHFVR